MRPTVESRLQRLIRHCRDGYARVSADPAWLRTTLAWLDAHPSPRADVDGLWRDTLVEGGPLAAWLTDPDLDRAPMLCAPLHTVLSSHPFRSLPRWSIQQT